jgi:hypothetical protein
MDGSMPFIVHVYIYKYISRSLASIYSVERREKRRSKGFREDRASRGA